jgi:prepilin-type N-terminal cleavage/methylation domain-containing protein
MEGLSLRSKMGLFISSNRSRGFSLTEMLLAIVILGILAGFMALTFGSSADSADAKRIASDLDTVKQAAISYSTTHQRRNADALEGLEGLGNAAAFRAALANDLDGAMKQTVILKDVPPSDPSGLQAGRYVGFVNMQISDKVAKILEDIAKKGNGYAMLTTIDGYALYLKMK